VGHTISQGMMDDGVSFLKTHLQHDEQYAIKPKNPRDMSVKELKQAVRDYGLGMILLDNTLSCSIVVCWQDASYKQRIIYQNIDDDYEFHHYIIAI